MARIFLPESVGSDSRRARSDGRGGDAGRLADGGEQSGNAFPKYPDLDDPFEDDGPSAIQLLLSVGQEAGTIVWLDWSGEEYLGATRAALTRACARLGLAAPAWDDETERRILDHLGDRLERGGLLPPLLVSIDEQLAARGMRLLLIDIDSDSYQLVPVNADLFARVVGGEGEGFTLRSAGGA
ncbi:DUF6630 family protein [Microbacterium barkeri]|nr:hypothetical protein [Microbacterium barkeri]MDR6877509.1 hypothetical protein [Microbacterium barkeri]